MSAPIEPLIAQTEELCNLHDHITRVIARLEIPQEAFSDRYSQPDTADFEFDSVVMMFLYQYGCRFTQSELYRRLKGAVYVWIRYELPHPSTQQATIYICHNRLSLTDHRTIKATARAIWEVASEHNIIVDGEPRLDPETVDSTEITDTHIIDVVETARERGLNEFDTKRANNATFKDFVLFERQRLPEYGGQGHNDTISRVNSTV